MFINALKRKIAEKVIVFKISKRALEEKFFNFDILDSKTKQNALRILVFYSRLCLGRT